MANRNKTLKAFKLFKAFSIGNKALTKSAAEDIVDCIDWTFDAFYKI